MEKLMEMAKMKIELLDFEECKATINQLEKGHPMKDLLMDRMESIDIDKFDEWLDEE